MMASAGNTAHISVDGGSCSIVLSGDLVLDVEDADYWLSGIAPATQGADVAIGHLEVPHSQSNTELKGDIPAPGADPDNLNALARAGFAAVTLAGNHIADCGPEGIDDTVAVLDSLSIKHSGAGANIDAARKAATLECGQRRIALLSYNCVGPEAAWASEHDAGCAYLRIETEDGSAISPTASLDRISSEAIDFLNADISAVRSKSDLVIVALHKGIVHTPATLAPYERPIAHAAIDAGADVVVGHHAHILRGIEFYRGKPVFHGIGNGCVVTRALAPNQDHPARAKWAQRRMEMFGFTPDPEYTLAPFHPEAVNAFLGRVLWHADGQIETGLIPVHVEAPGRPVLADSRRGAEICEYVAGITQAAGLPKISLSSREDMVLVS